MKEHEFPLEKAQTHYCTHCGTDWTPTNQFRPSDDTCNERVAVNPELIALQAAAKELGYALVPVEPTVAMRVRLNNLNGVNWMDWGRGCADCEACKLCVAWSVFENYKAMVAAVVEG